MAKVKRKKGKGGYQFFKELGGAPTRESLSKTATVLIEKGLIIGRVLDYGCGHGFDADHQGWEAYDPQYRPNELEGYFDTIIVNHVANILTRSSRKALFDHVESLLTEEGKAYISVPRNIPLKGKPGPRYRLQNYVILELPSLYADDKQEIYVVAKGNQIKDKTKEYEDQF